MQAIKRYLTLSGSGDTLDTSIEAMRDECNGQQSNLYRCELNEQYIAVDSNIVMCKGLEVGVIKIQKT